MPDHLHHSIIATNEVQMSSFIQDVTSTFTREYNKAHGRKGPMFESPYGRSQKRTDKYIRTNLTYLDNNPVERKLVTFAEEYRWNYLAYASGDHPFSKKIILRKASMPLRRALKMVKSHYTMGRYLTGSLLRRMFDSLPDRMECEQLTDYIISTYSVIDNERAISYYKTYDNELITAHANSGSEHDIKEQFLGRSDSCYSKMTRLLLKSGKVKDIHKVLTMTIEKKRELFYYLKPRTDAFKAQIEAFLHIPLNMI